MLEQKINVKKKIFKDEYKPTKEEEEFLKQKVDKDTQKPVYRLARQSFASCIKLLIQIYIIKIE